MVKQVKYKQVARNSRRKVTLYVVPSERIRMAQFPAERTFDISELNYVIHKLTKAKETCYVYLSSNLGKS